MAFRVFSVAKRISRHESSLRLYGSPHFLCNPTSSSNPVLNSLTWPRNSLVRSIHHSSLRREYMDTINKIFNRSEKLKWNIQKMKTDITEYSAEMENFAKAGGKLEEINYKDRLSKLYDEWEKLGSSLDHLKDGVDDEVARYNSFRKKCAVVYSRLGVKLMLEISTYVFVLCSVYHIARLY